MESLSARQRFLQFAGMRKRRLVTSKEGKYQNRPQDEVHLSPKITFGSQRAVSGNRRTIARPKHWRIMYSIIPR